jgi:parallel beta-helix repeat protein
MRPIIERLGWGVAGAAIVALVAVLAGIVSAGPLDPSDPPGSTSGVRLPGTAITALPRTISEPGSYYLIGDVVGVSGQDGITITTDNVTLDLNGFSVRGVPGAGQGIFVPGVTYRRGIIIRNGTVSDWPGTGVHAQFARGGVFTDLVSEGNGQWGFVIGVGATLRNCSAVDNNASGINASLSTIENCTSMDNFEAGFQVTDTVIEGCVSAFNTSNGISATSASHISGCNVYQNAIGIAASGSTVIDNHVTQNSGDGIEVTDQGSLVARNNVHANSFVGTGAGIDVPGTDNRIDENHVTDISVPAQEFGIRVTGAENVVIRNTVHGTGDNYSLTGAQGDYGPEGTAALSSSPWANISY